MCVCGCAYIVSCCLGAFCLYDGHHNEPFIINGSPDHMFPEEYNCLLLSAGHSHFTPQFLHRAHYPM